MHQVRVRAIKFMGAPTGTRASELSTCTPAAGRAVGLVQGDTDPLFLERHMDISPPGSGRCKGIHEDIILRL